MNSNLIVALVLAEVTVAISAESKECFMRNEVATGKALLNIAEKLEKKYLEFEAKDSQ